MISGYIITLSTVSLLSDYIELFQFYHWDSNTSYIRNIYDSSTWRWQSFSMHTSYRDPSPTWFGLGDLRTAKLDEEMTGSQWRGTVKSIVILTFFLTNNVIFFSFFFNYHFPVTYCTYCIWVCLKQHPNTQNSIMPIAARPTSCHVSCWSPWDNYLSQIRPDISLSLLPLIMSASKYPTLLYWDFWAACG